MRIRADIDCIPAGVYALEEENESFYGFSIGKRVMFAVANCEANVFEKLPKSIAKPILTSESDFAARYFALMQEKKRKWLFKLAQPFTACFIDPDLAKSFQQ